MKKLTMVFGIMVGLGLLACQEEELINEGIAVESQIADADIAAEESVSATYEEVDNMVEEGLINYRTGGRIDSEENVFTRCGEVFNNEANNTIEITFDGECEGPNGHVKSGKIIITYNDRKYVPGSFRSVTFEDFYLDSIKVEGTRTITNVSESTESNPVFNIILEGGKLSFPDGTFISAESNHLRTWIREENPINDQILITGEINGIKRSGVAYSSIITEELVYLRSCRRFSSLPVSGTKEITWEENLLIVDFGDGDCDRLVTYSLNGETGEREVSPRGFRKR